MKPDDPRSGNAGSPNKVLGAIRAFASATSACFARVPELTRPLSNDQRKRTLKVFFRCVR